VDGQRHTRKSRARPCHPERSEGSRRFLFN